MKTRTRHYQISLPRHIFGVAAMLCASAAAPVMAEDSLFDTGLSFWGAVGESSQFTASQGPALLRPPASWSWNDAAPELDIAAGVDHRFANGLNLNLGMSLSHVTEHADTINYRDYFLGMSFGPLEGKVWYLPETAYTDSPSLYYEAGWQKSVTENLALSMRLGQAGSGYSSVHGFADQPSLSLGASTEVRGYGLGLRLIDGGGQMFGGDQDLRVMGSISKPLP